MRPLRVLIASWLIVLGADDLTDDPTMLRKPQQYAEFVESQLGPGFAAPVLIVTPNGFGVAGKELSRSRARALVHGMQVPPQQGDALARAAMAAVRRIARAGGHPLPAHVAPAQVLSSTTGGGSIGTLLPAIVGALVFLLAWQGYELRRLVRRTQVAARSGRSG